MRRTFRNWKISLPKQSCLKINLVLSVNRAICRLLEKNREEHFTNDLIYDTLCGLINAPSNRYDAGQDFSSAEYKFNRETLTTMLGQHKLIEDKE